MLDLTEPTKGKGRIIRIRQPNQLPTTQTINTMYLETDCTSIDIERWNQLMKGARKASYPRLVWANANAMYRNTPLATSDYLSGLEMTKLVYNLEKTTSGKDSYRNYPAFAFCIEMNHDPENNMEWYLPSEDVMRTYAHGQSYSGTPLVKHNYWWTSTENTLNGNAFNLYSGSIASRGAVSKSEDWWVVAFRNGKIEE